MTLSLLWNVLFYAWLVSEILILVVTRTRQGGGKVSDRGSLWILWAVITLSISACEWIAAANRPNIFASAAPLKPLSVGVLALGLAIRWGAVLSLGRSFSANVAIRTTQRIHTKGMFRFVRHPSYLGLLLIFMAIGIRSRNWISLAIILVLPLAALLYRIHVEELALTEAFGEDYAAYCNETKRLLPFIY